MNKMIVTIFNSEKGAYKGLSALKHLHDSGDITLYASAVVSKEPDGSIITMQAADDGPVGTALGMFTGALIGLLSGPVGAPIAVGSAVGMGVGGLAGTFFDLSKSGVDYEFVDEVSQSIQPGSVIVLADIDETWITPLNTKMEDLDGTIHRKLRYEVVEHQFVTEIDAYRDEMKSLKQEVKKTTVETKHKLTEQIDLLERKISTLMMRTEDKLHRTQDEINSKIDKINQQMIDSAGEKKEKLIQNMHKLKAEFAEKKSKMDEAIDHARQALFPM